MDRSKETFYKTPKSVFSIYHKLHRRPFNATKYSAFQVSHRLKESRSYKIQVWNITHHTIHSHITYEFEVLQYIKYYNDCFYFFLFLINVSQCVKSKASPLFTPPCLIMPWWKVSNILIFLSYLLSLKNIKRWTKGSVLQKKRKEKKINKEIQKKNLKANVFIPVCVFF